MVDGRRVEVAAAVELQSSKSLKSSKHHQAEVVMEAAVDGLQAAEVEVMVDRQAGRQAVVADHMLQVNHMAHQLAQDGQNQ